MKKKRKNPNAEEDKAMRELFMNDYRTGYDYGKTGKDLPDGWTPGQMAGYLAGKAEQRRFMQRLEQRGRRR